MSRQFFFCLLALPLLCGCGDGDSQTTPVATTTVVTSPTRTFDPLVISATVRKTRFPAGEAIPITLNVTNTQNKTVSLVGNINFYTGYLIKQNGTKLVSGTLGGGGGSTSFVLRQYDGFSQTVYWGQLGANGLQVPAGQYTIQAFIRAAVTVDDAGITTDVETDLASLPIEITVE